MSDALTYLVKARPEAMGSYFQFLKLAGSHLDPKTRNLISVITKVHAQTEKGLRQYLTRALREGATADEVIDALLMAFPALGLTKVVWAIDVMLRMDLPQFRLAQAPAAPRWHEVAPLSAIKSGATACFECAGRSVFVHRQGKTLKVYDGRCPHQGTPLTCAMLAGATLTCPQHGWAFDLASGHCVANGDRPLTELPHKVEKRRLFVHC
jgi:nitrite reductase/ring-hydroxylating ferredoxin subunit/alkylhydroperoxidase/carboxymuconolactone decarboxylase family protein YurZ